MKTLKDIRDTCNNPLMLGTVQFGINYGIANITGKPSYITARDIVRCSYEGGVDALDTASIYGDSEEIIGRILVDLNIRDEMMVVTKIPTLPKKISAIEAKKWVEENLERSLKRLRLEVLPLVLLHREKDYEIVYEYLEEMIRKGKILSAGISGGSRPIVTAQIVNDAKIAALQIPINMFDKRFTSERGILDDAAAKKIAIFSRSAYWQGLAVMSLEMIESKGSYFARIIPIRRQLDELANEAGLTIFEMAMRYVLLLNGITRLLAGVETVEQMKQNIEIASQGPLQPELVDRIDTIIPQIPVSLIAPDFWPEN